jgi:DNA replicative helicase MCM subunit Mcm2 (Cdc46/Mcm family)
VSDFDHNPDLNPDWVPKFANRLYRCQKCGHERHIETNHTGIVWAARCKGSCRKVLHANTTEEVVLPASTPHVMVPRDTE